MKNKRMLVVKIIISVVLVLAILLIVGEKIAVYYLRQKTFGAKEIDTTTEVGTIERYAKDDGTPYLIKRRADGSLCDEFKVMSTTDMHLNSDDFSNFGLDVLSKFIDKEKPDVVILIGDNIVGRTDTVLHERLIKFFEDRQQYWAFVLGNHDAEAYAAAYPEEDDRKWAFESLANSTYCLSRSEDAGFGYGNCVFLLQNSQEKIAQAVFLLDSGHGETMGNTSNPETATTDALTKPQIDWYTKRVREITTMNGGITPKSMMYFHIPIYEFYEAYNNLDSDRVTRLYGDAWELVDSICKPTGLFEAIKELGSTQAVICGHDHINCFCLEYDGIKLLYSQGLQWDHAYNRRKNNKLLAAWYALDKNACFFVEGVTDAMVRSDGTVEFMPKYAQFEGVLDGHEDDLEEASFGVKNTYRK